MSQNVSDLLTNSILKIKDLVDANTVVGAPIQVGNETTIVPVSKIMLGVASAGADGAAKTSGATGVFGGGTGCGVSVTPVAFIVIQSDKVRVLPVEVPPATATDRLIDEIPELIDKLTNIIDEKILKKKRETEEVEM